MCKIILTLASQKTFFKRKNSFKKSRFLLAEPASIFFLSELLLRNIAFVSIVLDARHQDATSCHLTPRMTFLTETAARCDGAFSARHDRAAHSGELPGKHVQNSAAEEDTVKNSRCIRRRILLTCTKLRLIPDVTLATLIFYLSICFSLQGDNVTACQKKIQPQSRCCTVKCSSLRLPECHSGEC